MLTSGRGALAAAFLAACAGTGPAEAPPALPPLPPVVSSAELPRGEERLPREATFAFVGEVRGEIEPCGCPTLPYGGFERRQRLLDRLRAAGPLFHFDAGETLLKGLATDRTGNREARRDLLLRLSAAVGVDAWAPGPTDLIALGPTALAAIDDPPPVSATWVWPDGRPLLPPSRVVERDGLRIGVVGLSAEPSGSGDAVAFRDPVLATREAVAALPGDLDLVVAIGNVADADADRVAEVTGLAAVFTTRGSASDPPRRPSAGGALVVESSDRGRYLAVVRARIGTSSGTPLVPLPGERDWRERETWRERLRQGGDEEDRARLALLERTFAGAGRGRNLAWATSVPLADDLDGDTAVTPMLAAFKRATVKEATRRAAAPPPSGPAFASSGGCVNCHAQEFARWTFTAHARAFETLVRADKDDDPECVECHATGFGEPGGFGELTAANLRKFKGVQCEACHGPLALHPDDRTVRAAPIAEGRCRGCHDEANSPGFAFEGYLRRASCQAAEG